MKSFAKIKKFYSKNSVLKDVKEIVSCHFPW